MSRKRFVSSRDCPGYMRPHAGTRGPAGVPFLACSLCQNIPGFVGSRHKAPEFTPSTN